MVFKIGDRVRFKELTVIRNTDIQSMDWIANPCEEYVVMKVAGGRLTISPSGPQHELHGMFRGPNGQSVLELIKKGVGE
jgi:hypothetical protein